MDTASGPLTRTIPTPPAPGGVATAAMVSSAVSLIPAPWPASRRSLDIPPGKCLRILFLQQRHHNLGVGVAHGGLRQILHLRAHADQIECDSAHRFVKITAIARGPGDLDSVRGEIVRCVERGGASFLVVFYNAGTRRLEESL